MFSIIRSALLLDSWYHSSHKGGNSANGIPAHVQEERSTATQTGENFTWSDHSEVTKIGAGMNVVFLWFQLNLDYLLFFSSSDLVTTLVILQWATCILGGKDFISIKSESFTHSKGLNKRHEVRHSDWERMNVMDTTWSLRIRLLGIVRRMS